jgi:hypothetical protein
MRRLKQLRKYFNRFFSVGADQTEWQQAGIYRRARFGTLQKGRYRRSAAAPIVVGDESMKTRNLLLPAILLGIASMAAVAQDHSRSHEPGAVLALTHVYTKPGMFNAYINDLKGNWRRSMEIQKEAGHVLSYGMYTVVSPREGEPNLVLRVTYRDWATFDLGPDYWDELMESTFGSQEAMREAGIKREDLRTLGSEILLQELKFKD